MLSHFSIFFPIMKLSPLPSITKAHLVFQSQNARPAQGQNAQGFSPAVCSVTTPLPRCHSSSKVPFPFLLFVHQLVVLFQLTLFAEHLLNNLQGPTFTLPSFQFHSLFLIHIDITLGASYLVMFYNKWWKKGLCSRSQRRQMKTQKIWSRVWEVRDTDL